MFMFDVSLLCVWSSSVFTSSRLFYQNNFTTCKFLFTTVDAHTYLSIHRLRSGKAQKHPQVGPTPFPAPHNAAPPASPSLYSYWFFNPDDLSFSPNCCLLSRRATFLGKISKTLRI